MAAAQEITNLLNTAYRGQASTQGWTTEAHLISGNARTNAHIVLELLTQPLSNILLYVQDGNILGCVHVALKVDYVYLGMLSVSPQLQAQGIGKALLQAAEEWAATHIATHIYMTVISLRTELIAWYIRHGYYNTGITTPFIQDDVSGVHLQPLQFVTLKKNLTIIP